MKLLKPLLLILLVYIFSSGTMPREVMANEIVLPGNMKVESFCSSCYNLLTGETDKPGFDVFSEAFTGFLNLKAEKRIKKNILTIIDFSISSCRERMWIIDMDRMEVVCHSLVAHGKNSGEEFAGKFSNTPKSLQSSLGFYIAGEIYYGGHGMSLSLDGAEPGINDNARERSIVMHSAGYVSRDFISRYGRLGRSFGCPAIPVEDHERIIKMLTGESCLYIHSADKDYKTGSRLLSTENSLHGLSLFINEAPGLFGRVSDI